MSPCTKCKYPADWRTPEALIVQLVESLGIISPQAGILVRYHDILDTDQAWPWGIISKTIWRTCKSDQPEETETATELEH